MKPLALPIVLILALGLASHDAAAQPPTFEEARQRAANIAKSENAQTGSQPAQNAAPAPGAGASDRSREAPPSYPLLPEGVKMTPVTDAAFQEALRDYFGYFKFGVAHRQDVFAWQLFSSRIIFWAVLSLVALGMYFAAKQFQHGLRTASLKTNESDVTEFAASLAGVKVRSPVLGVIILVISFAFFYLYLRFVYPIEPTF